ncbi:MAG: ester cyclase [Chlorobi bacterium]|nr:ester cyclase [Chlorobiota bacterium]
MKEEKLKENKEITLNLSKAIMAGNWGKVNALLSDDFMYIGDGRPAIGKQEYIGFMKGVLSTAFTDMKMDFPRVIAEGDLVSVDYTNRMKHIGEWFGVPATKKTVIASGQFIRELKNGKITAEWQTTNGLGLMMQLTGQQ